MQPAAQPTETKFARRRGQILDIASAHINLHGARGMTLTAVAKALDLDTSSVTYYFRRKDALAAACLERTLLWARDRAVEAAKAADPAARVRALLAAHFRLHADQRAPGASQLALLSDLRSIDAETRAPLDALYAETVGVVRGFFAPGDGPGARSRTLIAATHLLATIHWLPGWIDRYHVRDFARVEARLFDILANGLGGAGAWPVDAEPLDAASGDDSAQRRFLLAATRLINAQGYVGASVEKIAAELGVSIGSFYHHLDNKDDLVVACFQRTFDVIAQAQARADQRGVDQAGRLAIMASSLAALQLSEETPLLRISAYQALPLELRERMLHLTGQATRHVAGTIADGIAEGSLRATDPLIASQTVMAVVNAASDLRRWSEGRPVGEAVARYVAPLEQGLFQD